MRVLITTFAIVQDREAVRIAYRALGLGTLYAVVGVGMFTFIIAQLVGVKSVCVCARVHTSADRRFVIFATIHESVCGRTCQKYHRAIRTHARSSVRFVNC